LSALGSGFSFTWDWVPSKGHSGGLLMGIDEDFAELVMVESSDQFQAMTLVQKDNFTWRLINMYGPVKDNLKQVFLDKLEGLINDTDIPTLIGGDFNLVRKIEEKSTGNVNLKLMDAFNNFVANTGVR